MTSQEIRAWAKYRVRDGASSSSDQPQHRSTEVQGVLASLETAYQLAKLNEYIEAGATITIRPPKDGRKFRD